MLNFNIFHALAKRQAPTGPGITSDGPSCTKATQAGTKTTQAKTETETVLQVLPALGGSGGVERGTVEIAGCISKHGWRSLVASNGGERVYQLQRAGAQHFELPLHSKNPLVMYANIGRLENLIRKEKVTVLHVRSRAPAWSAYFACKRTKTPFVTTFHGTYGAKSGLKRAYNAVMAKMNAIDHGMTSQNDDLKRIVGSIAEERELIRGLTASR